MTLAALHTTLLLYRNQENAMLHVPILRMLSMPTANLKLRADSVATQIAISSAVANCEVVEEQSMLGGGSLPTQKFQLGACLSQLRTNPSIHSQPSSERINPPSWVESRRTG